MHPRRVSAFPLSFLLSLLVVVFLSGAPSPRAFSQEANARISGLITDPSKAVITGANVVAVNVDTGVCFPTKTNGSGVYVLPGLPIGNYRVEVEHTGFKSIVAPGVVLHTQDALEMNFEMAIGSASESVTVNGAVTNDSPAVSMTVTREFIENMPLNGGSFQDLIQLAPGTVSSDGYYSINGQRTDSNNYTVDGVSANLGGLNNFAGSNTGAGLSGSAPAQTALGTTQSLASIDSLEEFTIQTSSYAAEYGRTPGGQVQLTTRSGTNEIHGTAFEYLRNTAFDANSFYNNYYGNPQTAEHQNDFGGTIGGPVIVPRLYDGRNRTFFFVSYEGLRLLLPSSESEYVPTQAFRSWVSPNALPYVNAAPLPSPNSPGNEDGCTVPDPTTGTPTACDALFDYGYSYPSRLNSTSVRIDETFGAAIHAFIRYADTPSSMAQGAEVVSTNKTNTHGVTAGLTATITRNLLDDVRFNYSYDEEGSTYSQRSIGASTPLPRDLVIPTEYDSPTAQTSTTVYVPNTSLEVQSHYGGLITTQHQYQLVDNLSWTKQAHAYKFGVDWRRLTPTVSGAYLSTIDLQSLADLQQGSATSIQVVAEAPGQPVFDNLSLYAQDRWKITPRLSIDYGIRWELNPPPGPSNGHYPAVLSSNNLTSATLAPNGTPPYKTSYHHFAPRFGFAWNAIPSQRYALTLRGGFGIFHDTGQTLIGNAYTNTYPFVASGPVLSEVPLPLSDTALAPPSLNIPIVPPYPYLNGAVSSPDLTLPYTEQWNLSADEALSAKNTLTVSYVGNNGRKLLFTQAYLGVPGNPAFPNSLQVTSNAAHSSYNALQVQDTGRIARGLDLVASFTFAHGLDNASADNSNYGPQWGNSNNDIRRALNLAFNYHTAEGGSKGWIGALTHDWLLSNRFSAQSGYPINVYQAAFSLLPNEGFTQYYPDLVPGVPIYLHGRAADANGNPVPASWRINRFAFACTTTGATSGACTGTPTRQGTLGRNYLRAPSFWSLNTALQRSFPIHERLHLNFRAEAFNIFNHPNLDSPDSTLSSSTFGQMVFGEITTIGSSNSLYSMGAARSLQLSLKLQF